MPVSVQFDSDVPVWEWPKFFRRVVEEAEWLSSWVGPGVTVKVIRYDRCAYCNHIAATLAFGGGVFAAVTHIDFSETSGEYEKVGLKTSAPQPALSRVWEAPWEVVSVGDLRVKLLALLVMELQFRRVQLDLKLSKCGEAVAARSGVAAS